MFFGRSNSTSAAELPAEGGGAGLDPVTIVVLGDWVVDEHWVTGLHRSHSAIRTGKAHVRALHPLGGTVLTLGAVGRVASILHTSRVDEAPAFSILGIGLWHKNDTSLIRSLLEPENSRGITPFHLGAYHRLSPSKAGSLEVPVSSEATLINLAAVLEKSDAVAAVKAIYEDDGRRRKTPVEVPKDSLPFLKLGFFDYHGTNRVIRVYQRSGEDLEILCRIDWELEIPKMNEIDLPAWITEEKTQQHLAAELRRCNDALHVAPAAILVYDHGKGAVSERTIQSLGQRWPRTPWYIHTSKWCPSWFNCLRDKDVRLMFFHQQASKEAVRRQLLARWLTRTDKVSQEGFGLIEGLRERLGTPAGKSVIVVLPDHWKMIARVECASTIFSKAECSETMSYGDAPRGVHGLIQSERTPRGLTDKWPMAGSLFPALVCHMIHHPAKVKPAACGGLGGESCEVFRACREQISASFDYALDAVTFWKKVLRDASAWETSARPLVLGKPRAVPAEAVSFEPFDWRHAQTQWADANRNLGIVKDSNGNRRLELWRTMTTLEGYVCCVPTKQKAVRRLLGCIGDFVNRGRSGSSTTSMSCMLCAEPGSGKTFLARRLASTFDMNFLSFNITQMTSLDDLLACFDSIVSAQAHFREKDLLVFFDEINAQLAGHHVYHSFLGPLSEGEYVREGKTFRLSPCAWVFAGTEPPNLSVMDPSEKGRDFESRLTIAPIRLDEIAGEDEREMRRLENVYVGVWLIRREFPDVYSVSVSVLSFFHHIDPGVTFRDLDRLVKSFEDVQYGKVSLKNIRLDRLESRFGVDERLWLSASATEDWVLIQV